MSEYVAITLYVLSLAVLIMGYFLIRKIIDKILARVRQKKAPSLKPITDNSGDLTPLRFEYLNRNLPGPGDTGRIFEDEYPDAESLDILDSNGSDIFTAGEVKPVIPAGAKSFYSMTARLSGWKRAVILSEILKEPKGF